MSDVKTIEQAPIEQTPRPIPEVVQKQYDHLVETIRAYNPGADFAQIDAAFRYAAAHHGTQKRKDGSPFVTHPIAVAQIVAEELHLDSESIIAALLHDCIEDTDATYDDIAKRFSPTVADLVEGVSKLTRVHYTSKEEEQMENLRKMLMAMAKDIRVILIKIADRTHNMRTMEYQSTDKQRQKSLETMEIYAPIAHRLGMQRMKWELEDLSLKYLDPTAFNEITHSLEEKSKEYGSFMERIQKQIEGKLTEDHIPFRRVYGRMKHPYSIYRKMYAQSKTMDEVFDLFAFRVIVDTVADCYNVLGVVHDIFKPIPNRFKDYISMPKPNMYQSLHTTVLDKNAIPFEIQIRTWEMHYTAEYGIAAHWKYKLGMGAGGKNNDKMEENIKKVKDMILDQLEAEDVTDIAKNIRNDFTENDVYVFSPRGDVFNLPQGSTPIDMAYLIHTQVGHRMVGAKINGKIVPIDYKLKTGDICEIITQKEEHPNRGWVDICKTASAKSKIRSWYKHEKRDENIAEGRQMLDKEFKRHGINLSEEEYPEFLQKLMIKKQYNSMDDFYAAVGYGGIQLWKIMPRLKEEYQKAYASDIEEIDVPQAPVKRPKASAGVVIEGADDVLVKFSKCCNPLPGDDIIGYITRGYGVSIHKRHCTNVPKDISKSEEPERWVSCYWEDEVGEAFRSTLQITATDRTGLLADVTIKLSDMHIFIHSLNSREAGVVTATIDVMGRNHLRGVISKLSDINGTIEVKRL